MDIVSAEEWHRDPIWEIFREVVAEGDTYAYPPGISKEEGLSAWFHHDVRTFVAMEDGQIFGTYILKANQPGLGGHVATASFMVSASSRGQGIGSQLCIHAMKVAKASGFLAMQFNLVVSTNDTAVNLWKRHGFHVVGRVPGGFRHSRLGYVDALIMHRYL